MAHSKQQWDASIVRQRLAANPRISPTAQTISAVSGYELAASVLSCFDPDSLRPIGTSGDAEFSQLLSHSSTIYTTDSPPRWVLHNEVRHQALALLRTKEAMLSALRVNSDHLPTDSTQHAFVAYLSGRLPPISQQTLEQLDGTAQIIAWLEGLFADLPLKDEVVARLGRERLFRPFRELVGKYFAGRQTELAQLSDYVGVRAASSVFESAKRTFKSTFQNYERPPLLVVGPGGVGKSTLIARFILDHADREDLLFVYLDLYRPGLLAEEPATLLIETLDQLGTLHRKAQEVGTDLSRKWREQVADRAKWKESSGKLGMWHQFVPEFVEFLALLGRAQVPFLIVLDNFEEVQYRSREFVSELWSFIFRLQTDIPQLRTVLAGRSDLIDPSLKVERLVLSDFDQEAAVGFLEARGISDRELRLRILRQVGGNALSLRLAAELVAKEGLSKASIDDWTTRQFFFFRLSSAVIQGNLYRRILGHIHDESVRRLAHPGLVLRRITPEIIKEVLSEPCGVSVPDLPRAEQLFAELRRESFLVAEAADGSLQHRSDVRAVMLRQLLRDEPDKTRLIGTRAIDYYSRRNDLPSRAEELYHRLLLSDTGKEAADKLTPEVRTYLIGSLKELPLRSQVFVASRLKNVELDPASWKEASLQEWELRVAGRAEDLLRLDRPEEVREIFAERSERTELSPLHKFEALALEQIAMKRQGPQRQELLDLARSATQSAIATASSNPQNTDLLDCLLLAARLDEKIGSRVISGDLVSEFDGIAERFKGDPRVIQFGLHRMRLLSDSENALPALSAIRERLLRLMSASSVSQILENPNIFIQFAAETVINDPGVTLSLVNKVGLVDLLSPVMKEGLATALRKWSRFSGLSRGDAIDQLESLLRRSEYLPSVISSITEMLLRYRQADLASPDIPVLGASALEISLSPVRSSPTSRSERILVVDIEPFGEGSIIDVQATEIK